MTRSSIAVRELLENARKELKLKLLSGQNGLSREITNPGVNRPGLLLAGFEESFESDRIQLITKRELSYLASLPRDKREESVERLFKFEVPAVVVSGHLGRLTKSFKDRSETHAVPLFSTELDPDEFTSSFSEFLSFKLAEVEYIHGTLVDVYGVGILLTGRSGIGKSEIALDMVTRGHILVADDVVKLQHYPKGVLTGSSGTREWKLRHFIEVRGLGLIDIQALHGIQAVRDTKRVEVHVELVDWSESLDYERVGLKDVFSEFCGVKVHYLKLPLNPGKNVGSILETIAKTYHLKESGYHPPQAFQKILLATLEERRKGGKGSENSTT